MARARSRGSADAAIVPFTPSSTSSVAALSGPATTTTGTPRAARLDDDAGRIPRVATGARGTAPSRAPPRAPRRRRTPAPTRRPSSPSSCDRMRRPSSAPARRRRSRRGAPGCCSRASRESAARAPAPASRGCGGRRTRRPAAPAAARSARAGRRTGPRAASVRRAKPCSRSRRSCSREKQNARCGTRRHARCIAPADRAAESAEILAPVRAGPDLVPVDDDPIPAAPARGGGREQREVREGRGVDDVVAPAVAEEMPQHAEAEDERREEAAPTAVALELRAAARRRSRARRGRPAPRPRSHCRERQEGDLVAAAPRAARRGCGTSARLRRSCTGTGSRRRCRPARGLSFQAEVAVAVSAPSSSPRLRRHPLPRRGRDDRRVRHHARARCSTRAASTARSSSSTTARRTAAATSHGLPARSSSRSRGAATAARTSPASPPRSGDYIVMVDADLTYDFREIPSFVKRARGRRGARRREPHGRHPAGRDALAEPRRQPDPLRLPQRAASHERRRRALRDARAAAERPAGPQPPHGRAWSSHRRW